MIKVLLYLWQLPQNLLGLLVILFTGAEYHYNLDSWYTDRFAFGVSLGSYIIFGSYFCETDLKHEKGHQKQSQILGWLYLPVIGLPSFVGNIIWRFHRFNYYAQPWEAWADRLGNVRRNKYV